MIRNGAVVAIVSLLLVDATVLPAQNPGAAPATGGPESTAHWCFRGRPRPQCDVFWLTEFGVAAPISSNPDQTSQGALFTWEFGGMVNRGTRHAVGVAAFGQAILWGNDQTGQGAGVGIRPRLRVWMGHTTSVDIAPGIVVQGSGAPGFSGHARLGTRNHHGCWWPCGGAGRFPDRVRLWRLLRQLARPARAERGALHHRGGPN